MQNAQRDASADHVVELSGALDVRAAADARLTVKHALDSGAGDLVVDLRAVTGIDATGLGLLVEAHRRAGRAGRTLVLRDAPPPVARLLARTRLDRVLRVTRTAA
ncbi:MAG TPA: STAS domain-containing protein [Mycobacteriales bacterium]|nr:STAS domain-containing protein [Mycobacteriales bacterium]